MANTIWTPQPRQLALMQRFEDEALYGGAAGGGIAICKVRIAIQSESITLRLVEEYVARCSAVGL